MVLAKVIKKSMFRYQLFALLIAVVAGRQSTQRTQYFGVRGGSSPLQLNSQPSYFSPRSPPKANAWSGSTSDASSSPIRDVDDISTKEMIDSFLVRHCFELLAMDAKSI
jgi:hypothetical protein